MNEKILFVDDEKNLLDAVSRNLGKDFTIVTANNGKEALDVLIEKGPFAMVVSDFKMPGMNGIEFLSVVNDIYPDSVRILLTGYADIETAIKAVNEGNIFRLLTKPSSIDVLKQNIEAGLKQYKLIVSEKELLEKTLKGLIKILTEILSLTNPLAFSRAMRVTRLARQLAKAINIKSLWNLEISAMLSQIGCISIPQDILEKSYSKLSITDAENKIFLKYPQLGSDLLKNIPRMEKIAEIILYQEKNFDGSGIPNDKISGANIPIESRIIKLILDFDSLTSLRKTNEEALKELASQNKFYDPNLINALEQIIKQQVNQKTNTVTTDQLKLNMIILEDIIAKNGMLLIPKGSEISPFLIQKLKNYEITSGLKLSIKVSLVTEM